jgi:phage major head subunit gpT-like protein
MDTNRAGLNSMLDIFFTEARAEWTEAMNAAKENMILGKIAMQVQSKTNQTRHAWLKQLPAMRKWVGDRRVNNLTSQTLNIVNDKFENTIEMTREEFEDDQYGLYLPLFGIMGRQAVATKDRMLSDAILAGTTATWGGDDVVIFTSSLRTYGDATINNTQSTAYDSLGAALTAAIKLQQSYLGHNGQPLMVRSKVLLHGPNLYDTVHKSVKNAFSALATGGSTTHVGGDIANPNKDIVELVMSEYFVDGYVDLDGTTHSNAGKKYALIGEAMGVRAGLIYQNRLDPEMQDQRAKFDSASDVVFLTDKLQWGVRMRGKAFIGLPHLIFLGNATAYGS